MREKLIRTIGILGTIATVVVFVRKPSFPTPDKLLVFGICISLAFNQAWQFMKRFVPFVVLLLVYESFRGLVPQLNNHVNYTLLPAADKLLFLGNLPTVLLQNLLWDGHVQWYDFAFYLVYMMHFVLPLVLAVIIWKLRAKEYWRYVTAYVSVSFAGFLTFLLFPAAPPWLASDKGLIEPIARISSSVWFALGVNDFPSLYNRISPNPVAAVPSLHAAYATLFALFVISLFNKSKWRFVALIYPVMIYVGTVYQGEHYAIDEIIGGLYALAAFWTAPRILAAIRSIAKRHLRNS